MPVDSSAIVRNARKNRTAVPAFNIPYLPMMEPVIKAVVDEDAFAFIAVARLEWIKFKSGSMEKVYEEFEKHNNPAHVNLHLDHIPVIDEDNNRVDYLPILKEAVALGYRSVMIDGSRLPFEENVRCTRMAVELAHDSGIACEAELGAVTGHEEEPGISYEELFRSGRGFTDVLEAKTFVEQTRCDWLSVAIGNVHGAIAKARRDKSKVAARLDLRHLEKLAKTTDIPLVLHGGSGVIQEYMLEAIRLGIAKVNVGTEIRQIYEKAMAEGSSAATARKAVYDRTVWVLSNHLKVSGNRKLVLETSGNST